MPAVVRTGVDLPAPLAPTMPTTLPCCTSNEASLSASTSRTSRSRRPRRVSVVCTVGARSKAVRYVTDTSWTLMLSRSDADRKVPLPGEEEQRPDEERRDGPARADGEAQHRRRLALVDRQAPGVEEQPDRVGVEHEAQVALDLVAVVQDRRDVQPDAQHVGQEVLQVAE